MSLDQFGNGKTKTLATIEIKIFFRLSARLYRMAILG